MARSHGRCPRGARLRMGFPHGHRKTTTLVAGLRLSGMVAPMALDGPINGDRFEACVRQVLTPTLRPGDIVAGVNGEPVVSIEALERALDDPRRRWRVSIERGGQVFDLTIG